MPANVHLVYKPRWSVTYTQPQRSTNARIRPLGRLNQTLGRLNRPVYYRRVPNPDRSAQTQTRLLASTAALLRERGYHGAGLGDILSGSGVPKGSLYHHFPGGKAELAAAALHMSGDQIITWLRRVDAGCASATDVVRMFCDHYIAELRDSDFRRGCPLATVALESAGLPDQVHDQVGVAITALTEFVAERLARDDPAATDPVGFATEIVAVIEGALIMAKATRTVTPIEIIRDRLIRRIDAAHQEAR